MSGDTDEAVKVRDHQLVSILGCEEVSHKSQITALRDARLHQAHISCGLWQQKPCDRISIQTLRPLDYSDHPVNVLPSLIKSYAARTNQNIASKSCVVVWKN